MGRLFIKADIMQQAPHLLMFWETNLFKLL